VKRIDDLLVGGRFPNEMMMGIVQSVTQARDAEQARE
jgi:hypothetical protein